MAADKLVLEATLIETALQAQIENLRGIKAKLSNLLDKKALDDYDRERLQALINLATGFEAYVDKPQTRILPYRSRKGEDNGQPSTSQTEQ